MPSKIIDSIDSGSNYSFGDKMLRPSNPRSMFNLSHLVSTTIHTCGALVPIACIPTLPGDSFEISVRSLLRVMPQVVPLLSRQRLYIHAFKSNLGDLWTESHTFMTKGYSGNTILAIPSISDKNFSPIELAGQTVNIGTLANYLRLPLNARYEHLINAKVNALPFMMYERIWRDYYMNRNLYIDNRKWLPDDDYDFRLTTAGLIKSNPTLDSDGPMLGVLRYRDYPADYFLSSLPFPQRGDTPTLDTTLQTALTGSVNFPDTWTKVYFDNWASGDPSGRPPAFYAENTAQGGNRFSAYTDPTILSPTGTSSYLSVKRSDFSGDYVTVGGEGQELPVSITLNQLRELAAKQNELEKMARTDGSYAEFGLTFFGRTSKNAIDYRPVYIGGTYQSVAFTEVLQTTSSSSSPLGKFAGHGISSSQDGYIGRCDCDDYGYIMIIASIMPDVYYSQGLDRMWTVSLQSDMYLPERAKLGMREILNKELLFTGNVTKDNDLFSYQNPFDEYRYICSAITGQVADPSSKTFYPYTQSRLIGEDPTYSQSFFTTKNNIRSDYLAAPSEDAYVAQFSLDIRAVRPLPYTPVPAPII